MKTLLLSLPTLLLPPLAALHAAEPAKPNILVIVAHHLGYGDIGVHGGKDVPTPPIDAPAVSGVRCTNRYVSAPYCSPSRAGFLTGRYQTPSGHECSGRASGHAWGRAAWCGHFRRDPC
jgi:arylsulfatase A-like enzyme